jgi:hypothetical protein
MTAEQILHLIEERIQQLYRGAQLEGPTQTDASLFELHMLYAEATGQSEKWSAFRKEEVANTPEWHYRVRGDWDPSVTSSDLPEVVAFWKGFGTVLGVKE